MPSTAGPAGTRSALQPARSAGDVISDLPFAGHAFGVHTADVIPLSCAGSGLHGVETGTS